MTTIITGATGGLGREVARRLAQGGVTRLVLPVRDARSGDVLHSEIQALGCAEVSTPLLDLASLSKVGQFIKKLRAGDLQIQGLLLNAGVQGTGLARDQTRIALAAWKYVMPHLTGILMLPVTSKCWSRI